jgi:uncharacterized protein
VESSRKSGVTQALILAGIGGTLIGLLLTVFGGGGSILATPWLIYVVGIADTHIAIGTSAAAVAVNAATGLIGQARAGTVKWPCATVFAITGLSGALLGARIGQKIDGPALLHWFALAMVAIAISMVLPRKSDGDQHVHLTSAIALRLVPIGFFAGLAAGVFGIGGGFLIAPGLMASTGMTLANASASSLVSVSLFGGATSVSYAATGQMSWTCFSALIGGGVLGTFLGLPVSRWLAVEIDAARRGFAAIVFGVAVYIFWQ